MGWDSHRARGAKSLTPNCTTAGASEPCVALHAAPSAGCPYDESFLHAVPDAGASEPRTSARQLWAPTPERSDITATSNYYITILLYYYITILYYYIPTTNTILLYYYYYYSNVRASGIFSGMPSAGSSPYCRSERDQTP